MAKKIIKIALSGDRGRMGLALKKNIRKDSFKKSVCFANRDQSPESWDSDKIDGVIDFSLPSLFEKSLQWCVANKKPFVSGTTGLSPRQKKSLKEASRKIPVFYSENMSWGIFCMGEWMSAIKGDFFDLSMEDIHHKDKKDKPSGTAILLKSKIIASLRKKLRIKSYRKGKEFGTHRVILKNKTESLTIEHKAFSRDVFAQGALKALEFTLSKKKGLYSLKDIY